MVNLIGEWRIRTREVGWGEGDEAGVTKKKPDGRPRDEVSHYRGCPRRNVSQ